MFRRFLVHLFWVFIQQVLDVSALGEESASFKVQKWGFQTFDSPMEARGVIAWGAPPHSSMVVFGSPKRW